MSPDPASIALLLTLSLLGAGVCAVAERRRIRTEELVRWLFLAAMLMLAASLALVTLPVPPDIR